MANSDSTPSGNGTYWSSIGGLFGIFNWREQVERSTITAATTQTSPPPRVPPHSNEFDLASPPGIYAAMMRGPDVLEAFLADQIPNYRWVRRYRSAPPIISHDGERLPDSFVESIPGVYSGRTLVAEPSNVTANVARYLSELQLIAVDALPEDGRTCAICHESYNSGECPEQPCKVGHCGHILGRACLSTWVTPAGSRPNSSCPLCRATLFENDLPDPTEDSDDVDERDVGEEILADPRVGEDEEPYNDDRMVHGGYASGLLDPAILCVIRGQLGQQAWYCLRIQWLERAGAGIAQPPYMLSEYVLLYFRRFTREIVLGSAGPIGLIHGNAALTVHRLIGHLYVRLRQDMQRTATPFVWWGNRRNLSYLFDPVHIVLLETALEHVVAIELQRYAAERRTSEDSE